MPAPAETTPDAPDPTASADPLALAAFVTRRAGRVLAYLREVTSRERALTAAGEAFAAYRLARAADPEAEAAATTLLRATRRAATAHAENPFRPEGRERSPRRTTACDAMPRLLIAWTEARLPDDAVERLVHHLQDCADCRALRDAFDRAELGYRAGQSTMLDDVAIRSISTAMAGADTPVPDAAAPTDESEGPRTRARRTAIPAAPSSASSEAPRAPRSAPAGRRTAIPAPPPVVPLPPAAPETAAPARDERPGASTRRSPTADRAAAPDDPTGPEALGYAVPRAGLPRPDRRPAVPRVRRRRRRRPPSDAVVAAASAARSSADEDTPATADRPPTPTTSSEPRTAPVPTRERTTAADVEAAPTADRRSDPESADRPSDTTRDVGAAPSAPADGDQPAVAPATVSDGGLQATGRRVLSVPIVRQLGVPAVLLLAVLIAALIAAGVFSGQSEDTVPPVSTPTLPTVPADPTQIPSLR